MTVYKAQHTSLYAICTCNPHRKPENNAHHVDKQPYIHSTVTERQTFPASLSSRLFFLLSAYSISEVDLNCFAFVWGGGFLSGISRRHSTGGEKKSQERRAIKD